MRIYTKIVIDIESGKILEAAFCEYDGPVDSLGGGPSPEQVAAANAQNALGTQLVGLGNRQDARATQGFNLVFPFAKSRLSGGLPFYNALTDFKGGTTARAFAPIRGQILRSMSTQSGLPSGSKDAALRDLGAQEGENFDQNLTSSLFANEQAKAEAARLITGQQQIANPLGYYGAAGSNFGSVANDSSLARPSPWSAIAGAAGGAASAIPF